MKAKTLNNSGDTIVEVLIAIAIVSLVLAGAYASSRRSTNTTQTAQERGEALKLAESQIEQIKQAIDTNSPDVIGASNFCLNVGVVTPSCTGGSGNLYNIVTTHTAGSHDFEVKITWDSLVGAINNLELDYRAE